MSDSYRSEQDRRAAYREFGVQYAPAVGFVPRNGFRRLQPTFTFNPLIDQSKTIRELSWEYDFEYLMFMDWRPAIINHNLRFLGIRTESGDIFYLNVYQNYENLNFIFDVLRDGQYLIQKGIYKNNGYSIEIQTAPFRRIGGTLLSKIWGSGRVDKPTWKWIFSFGHLRA